MSNSAVTLVISPRDVQWLCGALGVCSTLLHPAATDDEVAINISSMFRLLDDEYSGEEANALQFQLRAALPANTKLRFDDRDGGFAPSASTYLQ